MQPNVCFCRTVWKQYLFRLYPNWLSEHGQQRFNICVTAHKPGADSLAAPAAFSTVSVNMHNIWNTSVKALPAWRPSSATKKKPDLGSGTNGPPAYFPGQPQDLWTPFKFPATLWTQCSFYASPSKVEEKKMGLSINLTLVRERWWHHFKCVLSCMKYNACAE